MSNFLELFEESVSVFILWQLIKTFGHILCFPKSNLWILGEVKARRKNRKTIVLIVCCENSWKQDIEIKFFKTVGNTIQLNMRFKKSGPAVPCIVYICVGSRQNLSYGRADNNGWPMTTDPDCKKYLLWWFSNNFEVGQIFLILDTSEVGGDDPSTSNRWCQIMHRRGRQQQQQCNLVIFRDTAILEWCGTSSSRFYYSNTWCDTAILDVILQYLMWCCNTWCGTAILYILISLTSRAGGGSYEYAWINMAVSWSSTYCWCSLISEQTLEDIERAYWCLILRYPNKQI